MRKNIINIDSSIFIFVRYFSFTIACVTSIFLNIFFFQSLDSGGFWYILFAISILVESAKISTILTKNVFSSLYVKTFLPKILHARNMFFTFYIILAILSISSGAGFAYYSTETVDTTKTIEVQNIEDKIEMVAVIRERIGAFSDQSDITLSEYAPFIRAQERLEESRSLRDDTQLAFDTANSRWMSVRSDSENANYQRYLDERTAANSALTIQRNNVVIRERELDQVQIEFNDRGSNTEVRLAELDAEFMMTIGALNITLNSASLDLPLINRARLVERELNLELRSINDQIKKDKGMQIIFDDLGEFLDISPRVIKLILLLFVAFVIELIIFQCSPDIKVTRDVLYYFRNKVPHDTNIDELLAKFDAELNRFTTKEEPEEQPISEKRQRKSRQKKQMSEPENDLKIENITDQIITQQELMQTIPADSFKERPMELPTKSEPVEIQYSNGEKSIHYPELTNHPAITGKPIIPTAPIDEVLVVKDEPLTVPANLIVEDNKTIKYRFGRASQHTKEKLCEFVRTCIKDSGAFDITPDVAADRVKINRKAKNIFLDHLSRLKYNGKLLIQQNKYGEYEANFSAEEIIKYATEIVED